MSFASEKPLERAARFLEGSTIERIVLLAGDASNRAYVRVVLPGDESRVVALMPEPFDVHELPFLEVAALFRKIPVRIPEVIEVAGDAGILVLEDLGDALLQDVVESCDEARKRELYAEAIDILARLQARGAELESERFLPFRIAFDEEKFVWELEFFREHFLEGLRKCYLASDERDALGREFRSIAAELCSNVFALCHRDYHARNLLVVSDELAVIDFQDARRGPRAYDLVSLLNDSYVVHAPELVEEMVERFEGEIGASVSAEYDVAALQRNLKALGTFGFQIGRRGNDVYRRYLPATLALVARNLERNPRWDGLRRILARHCEEIS